MKKSKIIIITFGCIGALLVALILSNPRLRTALRITPGFQQYPENKMVYYEAGAEDFAGKVADFYDLAITSIESRQFHAFKQSPRIYVCATHDSFTSRTGNPATSPVRGIALTKDICISPLSLSFMGEDTHRQTVLHELSHLHLNQTLGWIHRAKTIPSWFNEGLADLVSGLFGKVSDRNDAIRAIKNSQYFLPDSSGRLPLPKYPSDYGIPAMLLHKQSRMFVDYLVTIRPDGNEAQLKFLYAGRSFNDSFYRVYGKDLTTVWREFIEKVKLDEFSIDENEDMS